MKKVEKPTASIRSVIKYRKYKQALKELVEAIQSMQPGATIISEAAFTEKEGGGVRLEYIPRPLKITIQDGGKRIEVYVLEDDGTDLAQGKNQ